eukprot:9468958-Pyramimonas_sp.AAC.2
MRLITHVSIEASRCRPAPPEQPPRMSKVSRVRMNQLKKTEMRRAGRTRRNRRKELEGDKGRAVEAPCTALAPSACSRSQSPWRELA